MNPARRSDYWSFPLVWTLGLALACAPRSTVRPDEVETRTAPPLIAGPAPTEPTVPRPITVVAGGDVTLGFHYEEWVDGLRAKGQSGPEIEGWGFAEVKPLFAGADLVLVNLECPFTSGGAPIPKNFNFRARPSTVQVLVDAGVRVVSLANNHLMDYGPDGVADTIATLDAAGIAHFGAGRTLAEARRPAIVEIAGLKVAFLGYLILGEKHPEPAVVWATETSAGVAGHPSDWTVVERMVREDVAAAKTQADLVIPFFHWGREGSKGPDAYQIALAKAAVESGAAAVLGSHPHVLHGMERIGRVPVFYSLGNLVFGGNWNPRDKDSVLVKARFDRSGYLGAELFPLKTDRFPDRPIQPYPLTGADAQAVMQRLRNASASFATPLPELAPPSPPTPVATPSPPGS
ncbi:MAG TPA: CapA family protein [Myxococcaceae bacterium]|nr:CapA family protein [Myxococcaceae bacterium]